MATSSYNDALERKDILVNDTGPAKITKKRKRLDPVIGDPSSSAWKRLLQSSDKRSNNSKEGNVSALVRHSQLRSKPLKYDIPATKGKIIQQIFGRSVVDEGVYGPLPNQEPTKESAKNFSISKPELNFIDEYRLNHNLPDDNLPEKCPW